MAPSAAAEYLLAEVLDSQPPEVRRLLVRASLLDRINGPLGDLLTGSPGAVWLVDGTWECVLPEIPVPAFCLSSFVLTAQSS